MGGCLLPTGAASAAASPPRLLGRKQGRAAGRVPVGGGMDGWLASARHSWGIGVGDRSPLAPSLSVHAHRVRGCCRRASPGATGATPWARWRCRRTGAGSWTASRSRRARLPRRTRWPAAFTCSRRPPSIPWCPLAVVDSAACLHCGGSPVLYCASWGCARVLAPLFCVFRVTWPRTGFRTKCALISFVVIQQGRASPSTGCLGGTSVHSTAPEAQMRLK